MFCPSARTASLRIGPLAVVDFTSSVSAAKMVLLRLSASVVKNSRTRLESDSWITAGVARAEAIAASAALPQARTICQVNTSESPGGGNGLPDTAATALMQSVAVGDSCAATGIGPQVSAIEMSRRDRCAIAPSRVTDNATHHSLSSESARR
jgi:hypothetical protein